MDEKGSNRLKEIFADAAELNGLERQQYLDHVCAGDDALRERVECLLEGLAGTGDILDATSVGQYLRRADSDHALSAGEIVGRFRVVRLIGKGGMGEVYEAEDQRYGRRIALKTLRPEFLTRSDLVARFHREIRLAWRVTHPNICRVYDVGECQIRGANSIFLTMELLEGETLADRLKRGAVEPEEALRMFQQIASGLSALHEARLVHRDLKPANVMLSTSESDGLRCVITDFGLAHQPEPEAGRNRLTQGGQVMGTPAYMSPEQLSGKEVVAQSDIYSLGIVMYEVLCGKRPFAADQIVESAAQKTRAPQPPSRIQPLDARWDSLILGCLQPSIEKRPRSALEVSARLGALATPQPAAGLWARARHAFVPKPMAYATAVLTVAVAALPMRIPAVRTPLLRQACRQIPGVAAVCELPLSKSMALFPSTVEGASPQDRALAAGLAQYLREAFQRLFPNPGSVCVHLRNDRRADGVQLVVESEVHVRPENVLVTFTVREQGDGQPAGSALTLRRMQLSIPRSEALRLHWEPVLQLASLLDADVASPEWHAWRQLVPRRPESLLSHFTGLGLLQQGLLEEAAQAFSKAIGPGDDFAFAPAQVGLGDAYRLMGNKTHDQKFELRARQAYRRAAPLDRDFGFGGAEKRWGELEAGAGNSQAAIEHLSSALRLWPHDAGTQRSLSAAYEAASQDRRSEGVLRDAVQQAPQCWLAHNTLADFYSRRARFQEAEAELLEVVRLAPRNANAYHNLAFNYIKEGRLDDAIEMASKAIGLRPIPLAYSTLGRAYLYRGCVSQALSQMQHAVQLDPAYFVVWANLAEGLYASSRKSEQARDAFGRTVELARRAVQLDPSQAYAQAQLALNLARMNHSAAALEAMDRAVGLAGESHDIMLLTAETLEALRLRTRALRQVERALQAGLSVHQVELSIGLAELRRDPAYASTLRRLKLNPSADPGGLTPGTGKPCPEPLSAPLPKQPQTGL